MNALSIDDGDEAFSEEDDEEFSVNGLEGNYVENAAERDDTVEDEVDINGGLRSLCAILDNYLDIPQDLFSASEPQDLKNKERTLIERRKNGYS